MSETQVVWMLETTEEKPRERASFCKEKIRHVCYLGELNAVVQQEPPAMELDHDYHTGASYWGQAYKDVNAICDQQ